MTTVSPKPTPERVEVFAGALAVGESQAAAFRKMHPRSKNWKDETVHSKASSWAKLGKVQERVKALQEGNAEKAAKVNRVTLEMVSAMHMNAYSIAKEDRQPAAMTSAAQNLAKLNGLIVDKQMLEAPSIKIIWPDGFTPNNASG